MTPNSFVPAEVDSSFISVRILSMKAGSSIQASIVVPGVGAAALDVEIGNEQQRIKRLNADILLGMFAHSDT